MTPIRGRSFSCGPTTVLFVIRIVVDLWRQERTSTEREGSDEARGAAIRQIRRVCRRYGKGRQESSRARRTPITKHGKTQRRTTAISSDRRRSLKDSESEPPNHFRATCLTPPAPTSPNSPLLQVQTSSASQRIKCGCLCGRAGQLLPWRTKCHGTTSVVP